MAKHGKRYDDAKAQINPEGNYHPLEAFRLLVSQEVARFDTTVEAHFRLGVNVRHAEEQLRGTIALPHGTGRAVTVAVFAEDSAHSMAHIAGRDDRNGFAHGVSIGPLVGRSPNRPDSLWRADRKNRDFATFAS